jgi:hypothetical protein
MVGAVAAAVARAAAIVPVLSQGRFAITEPGDALCARLSEHLHGLAAKYDAASIEEVAEAEAADFVWPPEAFDRDAALVRSEGSLLGAITAKRNANRAGRFNVERVNAMFREDPDYLTLLDIAEHGARIELPPGAVLASDPPAMRAKQQRMPLTVQKHAFKLWQKGRGMVLRMVDIPEA